MLKRKVALFCSIALLLALAHLSQGDAKVSLLKGSVEHEIRSLVSQLGSAAFSVRERAMKRLEETGEPALDALYDAKNAGDAEICKRAQMLITSIEWKVMPVKTVNGMQFRLVVDKTWSAPKAGGKRKINIGLEVKNISDRAWRFYLGYLQVLLTDSRGNKLPSYSGSHHFGAASSSPPVAKNEIFAIDLDALLCHTPDGLLQFGTHNPNGSFTGFDNIRRRTYQVSLKYQNLRDTPGAPDPLWIGFVETYSRQVVVR
jgi:hypothetical protein